MEQARWWAANIARKTVTAIPDTEVTFYATSVQVPGVKLRNSGMMFHKTVLFA